MTETNDDLTTYWVKFKEETGKILAISKHELPETKGSTVITTTSEICEDIKKTSLRKYKVYWNSIFDTWEVQDSTTIRLKGSTRDLIKITGKEPTQSDVNISINRKRYTITVSLNIVNITQRYSSNNFADIMDENSDYLWLFVVDGNNIDSLAYTFKVSLKQLFNDYVAVFDIDPEIDKYIKWENISIMTPRLFSTYSMIINDGVDDIVGQNTDARPTQCATREPGHIEIIPLDDQQLSVISNIQLDNNEYVISDKKYFHFIVSDGTIDNIQGTFTLKSSALVNKSEVNLRIDFKWPDDPIILFKNKKLKVTYRGE